MTKYIVKRLLVLIPILLGVTLIIFTIMDFTPGDPAVRILGPESSIEAREQLREELGLNQPFWVRFFDYPNEPVLEKPRPQKTKDDLWGIGMTGGAHRLPFLML